MFMMIVPQLIYAVMAPVLMHVYQISVEHMPFAPHASMLPNVHVPKDLLEILKLHVHVVSI